MLTRCTPNDMGNFWCGVLVAAAFFPWLLVVLDGWLSNRNTHTRPVKWNRKKGWHPWWMARWG